MDGVGGLGGVSRHFLVMMRRRRRCWVCAWFWLSSLRPIPPRPPTQIHPSHLSSNPFLTVSLLLSSLCMMRFGSGRVSPPYFCCCFCWTTTITALEVRLVCWVVSCGLCMVAAGLLGKWQSGDTWTKQRKSKHGEISTQSGWLVVGCLVGLCLHER